MAPPVSKRSIFRDRALQKYTQGREKNVLPRIVAPPVFVLCWILLMVLMAAGLVAWQGQIPLYISGSGVILTNTILPSQGSDEALAVVILPASEFGHIHSGLSVQIHIGQSGPELTRTVDYVNPALVIITRLGPEISRRLYAGSAVQAQVLVETQRLLSLFPLFSDLLKDA
jgi:hypothetical protein